MKVLFLSASPRDLGSLPIDEELRAIDEAIRASEYRDQLELEPHGALRVGDLQGLLLRHRPAIVHFSGHGTSQQGIALADDDGMSQPVPAEALEQLFALFRDDVRCVVLNACWSEMQARAIVKQVDFVIGMSRDIVDDDARRFASAFYQALAYGRTVQQAFDQGCVEIGLHGLEAQQVPKLLSRRADLPAATVAFVKPVASTAPIAPRRPYLRYALVAGAVGVAAAIALAMYLSIDPGGGATQVSHDPTQVAIVLSSSKLAHLGADEVTSPYEIVIQGRKVSLTRRGLLLGGPVPTAELLRALEQAGYPVTSSLEPLTISIEPGMTIEAEIYFEGAPCGTETFLVEKGARVWPVEQCREP